MSINSTPYLDGVIGILSNLTAYLYDDDAPWAVKVIKVKSKVLAAVDRVNTKVNKVKTDIAELKTDVTELKMDVVEIKTETRSLGER